MNRTDLPIEHFRVRWFFASLYLMISVAWLLFQLEPMRSGESDPPWRFGNVGENDTGWIALLFAGLFLANAWLLDSLLELPTRQQGRTRRGIRVFRFLTAGVPLVGVFVIPLWLWVLDRKPAWALAPLSSAPSPTRRLLLFFTSRIRWLQLSVPFFGLLLIGNLFFFAAGVAWLDATRATLFGLPLIELASWMLHILGVAAGLVFVAAQRSAAVPLRVPRPIPWALPFLWLLPGHWCMAGALVVLVFDPQRRMDTLVQEAFKGREPTRSELAHRGRLLDWWKLSLLQKFRWRSGRSPAQPAEAEKRLAGLYRLKTFLLFLEVALLTAVAVASTRQLPFAQALVNLLGAAFYGTLVVALAGALLGLRESIHSPRDTGEEMTPDSRPGQPGWRLLLSALAVAAGIYTGVPLGAGGSDQFAVALESLGLAGMVAAFVLIIPFRFGRSKIYHHSLPLIAWFFVFAGLAFARSWIPSHAPSAQPLLFAILCLAPVASALTGGASLRWLLHPFTLRQLNDGNLPQRLRLSLLFLAVTAWAPGGGLAVPFWPVARRRLQTPAAPVPAVPQRQPVPSLNSLASLPTEKRDYLIHHGIELQVKAGATETLFRYIEKHPFFAEQANCSGGFLRGSEDIEKHILPLALHTGDWERFLRYSALAINLRRMADDLAEPDLLPALARHGHRQMASDAAARVSDPAQRALGRAALAASLDPGDTDQGILLDLVRADLALLAPIDDPQEAETRAAALIQIGLHLGPDILSSLKSIPPAREGQEPKPGLLAMSVAICALRRGGGLDEEGWTVLRDLREEEVLAEFLPTLLGHAVATAEPARLQEKLSTLSLKTETLWACRLSILAAWARTSPEEACHAWKTLRADPPVPWSVALIERGAPLFATLSDPEIDGREQEIKDPIAQAALRVAILESRQEGAPDTAAREAIQRLPPGSERLHWMLRHTTASLIPDEIRKNETRAIGRQLFEQQYRAPFDDLRRYLELVARCLPEELQRRAEDVLLSPGGAPLLFHLPETCDNRAVLENLFEQAESYLSSLFGLPELEGLRLWREMMHQLTGRLCLIREDLTALDQAAEKIREADSLAARATATLAGAGSMDLAAQAASRIRSGRLRLATRLRWLPETVTSSAELEPETLYDTLASVSALEDEGLGLAALHDPAPPEILFQRYLERIGDRDTQIVALYRLARQILDHPRTTREKKQLVLQMLGQALSALQSNERLVALTPWLPELVARVDLGRTVEEYREAFARLIGFHMISWQARRDALEALLVRLTSTLFARKDEASRWTRSAGALFAGFEQLLAHGIPGQEESVAADFLPVLTAALERLPAQVAASLGQPLGSRLRFSDVDSEQIRSLCQASTAERLRTLETWRNIEPPFRLAQALIYLLVREKSDRTLALLDQLPASSQRDDLCRRLVAHGWVTGQAADEFIQRIGDSDMARETAIRTGRTSHEWLTAFASFAAENGVNPSDPVWTPLLQELWSSEPGQRRQVLGESVLTALGQGAPQTAESALRLWLHAHLSPQDRQAQARVRDSALGAIRTALTLSPASGA